MGLNVDLSVSETYRNNCMDKSLINLPHLSMLERCGERFGPLTSSSDEE